MVTETLVPSIPPSSPHPSWNIHLHASLDPQIHRIALCALYLYLIKAANRNVNSKAL